MVVIRPAKMDDGPRCGAMNRQHTPCKCPAMRNCATLPLARWQEHGSANAGKARGESPRAVDARRVFAGNEATPGRQSPPMAGTLRLARWRLVRVLLEPPRPGQLPEGGRCSTENCGFSVLDDAH